MARFWGVDPDVVGKWSMPKYTDREEFMNIQLGYEDEPNRPETEWKGRN